MFRKHAMHRLVAQYLCEVVGPCTALPLLKKRSADVERVCLAILAVLKVARILLTMGDGDGTNLPVLDRISQ